MTNLNGYLSLPEINSRVRKGQELTEGELRILPPESIIHYLSLLKDEGKEVAHFRDLIIEKVADLLKSPYYKDIANFINPPIVSEKDVKIHVLKCKYCNNIVKIGTIHRCTSGVEKRVPRDVADISGDNSNFSLSYIIASSTDSSWLGYTVGGNILGSMLGSMNSSGGESSGYKAPESFFSDDTHGGRKTTNDREEFPTGGGVEREIRSQSFDTDTGRYS